MVRSIYSASTWPPWLASLEWEAFPYPLSSLGPSEMGITEDFPSVPL